MIINKIEVKNFRCIKNATLECDNLTAIVGRNGAGKSSFLYALDIFYDTAAQVTLEDFFNRECEEPIEIRVSYGNLREEELKEFNTYIKKNELIVTKRILFENSKPIQKYYGVAQQIPEFAEIRKLSKKSDKISMWNKLVDENTLENVGPKTRKGDDVEIYMNEYEKNHPDKMVPVEREAQFIGAKNIGGGMLDNYTKYVLIPAVREAYDETTGRKSSIYQLIDMIVARKINDRKDIREFKTEFEEKVKKLYNSDNLTELPELGKSISKTLKQFSPGSQLNLLWEEAKLPEIQLPEAKATLIEDNFEGDIKNKGHGLQRALVFTLLQHLALTMPIKETESSEEKEDENIEEQSETTAIFTPDLILGIEEPELYLHPSRTRYLSKLFLELANNPATDEGGRNQIMYATHSPYFIDIERFDNVRVINKTKNTDDNIPETFVTRFSIDEAIKELARINNDDISKYTKESFKSRTIPVMKIIVNEGFFANLVVVVEGYSDLGIFWKLQEILKQDWIKDGITVVPADGKNNIDRPVITFRGLSIPTYFIFDGDIKYSGDKKGTILKNHRLLRLAGVEPIDFPETQVLESWAVFKDNIEIEIKEAIGEENFIKIRNDVSKELGYNKPSNLLKNIEGAGQFVQRLYDEGYKVKILEDIIKNITNLSKLI
jgi:predicted ATP-dependent endonuclease of OLD family